MDCSDGEDIELNEKSETIESNNLVGAGTGEEIESEMVDIIDGRERERMKRKVLGSSDELEKGEEVILVSGSSSEVGCEEYELRKMDDSEGDIDVNLHLEPVMEGASKDQLIKETKEDKRLENWRTLADKIGYKWKAGILVQSGLDHFFKPYEVLILPQV